MKMYGFALAPNPRKLLTYVREKNLDFEYVEVDLPGGEHRQDWFRQKNPMASLPVLEVDDGTCMAESLAIIEYLGETNPDPPMIDSNEFVAGPRPTIADCTLFASLKLAQIGGV